MLSQGDKKISTRQFWVSWPVLVLSQNVCSFYFYNLYVLEQELRGWKSLGQTDTQRCCNSKLHYKDDREQKKWIVDRYQAVGLYLARYLVSWEIQCDIWLLVDISHFYSIIEWSSVLFFKPNNKHQERFWVEIGINE